MLIDMHNHTRHGSSDSVIGIDELLRIAKQRGVDGVCITEQDKITKDLDLDALIRKYELKVFAGVEMSISSLGHFLCYGIDSLPISVEELKIALQLLLDNLSYCSATIESEELMRLEGAIRLQKALKQDDVLSLFDMIHNQNGVVFWAHPFDSYSLLGTRFNEYVEKRRSLQMQHFHDYIKQNDSFLQLLIEQVDGFEAINGFHNGNYSPYFFV